MAVSKGWYVSLIAIGSASNLIYPHVPLVSFATLAGVTLRRNQAIVAVVCIWCVNQLVGFTIRQYPLNAIALLWGLTMGLGSILVALIASMRPTFSYHGWVGQLLWLGVALLLGFTVYQSSTLLVHQWVGMHGLTVDVFLRIFVRDGMWTIGLYAIYYAIHKIFRLNYQQRLKS